MAMEGISNEASAPEWAQLHYTWTVNNFWELRSLAIAGALENDNGQHVKSSKFGDMTRGIWQLKLYPFGHSSAKGEDSIGLDLVLDTDVLERAYAIIECRVDDNTSVNNKSKTYIRKTFTREKNTWGWSSFVKVSPDPSSSGFSGNVLRIHCQLQIYVGLFTQTVRSWSPISWEDDVRSFLVSTKDIWLRFGRFRILVNSLLLRARCKIIANVLLTGMGTVTKQKEFELSIRVEQHHGDLLSTSDHCGACRSTKGISLWSGISPALRANNQSFDDKNIFEPDSSVVGSRSISAGERPATVSSDHALASTSGNDHDNHWKHGREHQPCLHVDGHHCQCLQGRVPAVDTAKRRSPYAHNTQNEIEEFLRLSTGNVVRDCIQSKRIPTRAEQGRDEDPETHKCCHSSQIDKENKDDQKLIALIANACTYLSSPSDSPSSNTYKNENPINCPSPSSTGNGQHCTSADIFCNQRKMPTIILSALNFEVNCVHELIEFVNTDTCTTLDLDCKASIGNALHLLVLARLVRCQSLVHRLCSVLTRFITNKQNALLIKVVSQKLQLPELEQMCERYLTLCIRVLKSNELQDLHLQPISHGYSQN